MFDEGLIFKFHTSNNSPKLSQCAAMIYKVRNFVSCEVLKTLYYTDIYLHLLYCNPIWSTTHATHLKCINLLHKKIIRIITQSSFLEHTTPLFKKHKHFDAGRYN